MLLDKIDVRKIVTDHLASLREYGQERAALSDLLLFFAVPAALGGIGWWRGTRIPISAVSGLMSAYSIFMGLLPSLLVMVVTFLGTTKGDPVNEPALRGRKALLRELASNLGFAILLALALVVIAMCTLILSSNPNERASTPASFLVIGGTTAFVLTLLMILKRIYALVLNELDRHKFRNAA